MKPYFKGLAYTGSKWVDVHNCRIEIEFERIPFVETYIEQYTKFNFDKHVSGNICSISLIDETLTEDQFMGQVLSMLANAIGW